MGREQTRATNSKFVSVMMCFPPIFRSTLWLSTVPIAKIAPSHVDIDAERIPIRPHPPRKTGILCVSSLMTASGSGSHKAQVGNPSAIWQVCVSRSKVDIDQSIQSHFQRHKSISASICIHLTSVSYDAYWESGP
jgi:hypothetical protein